MHHILNLILGPLLGFIVLSAWAQVPTPPISFPDFSSSTTIVTTTTSLSSASPGTSATTSASTTTNATSTNSAEFPSLGGYPPCVSDCLATSVGDAGCGSVTEINCFCASDRFPLTMFNCISASCASEIQSAESLAQQFCNVGNFSTSLSFPPMVTSTSTTLSSSTTLSASSNAVSTTSTNGAAIAGLSGLMDRGMYTSVAMTVFGGILGVYLMD